MFQVTLGPAERGSSPLLSPVLSDAGGTRMDDEEEPKHKVGTAPSRGLGADGPGFADFCLGWEGCGWSRTGLYAHTALPPRPAKGTMVSWLP